jgi:hydroxyacylglutathione hydrolase
VSAEIVPIPCLKDNYAYLVWRHGSSTAIVIDACEAAPIERALQERGLTLSAILTTHHHHDHVGGNTELVRSLGVPVYGHVSELGRIPELSVLLQDAQAFEVGGFSFEARHVPAHTRGALAYRLEDACFTGDTLFTGGAGRLFEGTPGDLFRALFDVLGRLPVSTTFYTGHEYTLKNLEFARTIEPSNVNLASRYEDVLRRRQNGEYTASATLFLERATNPFFRVDRPEIAMGLGLDVETDLVDVMRKLREARNEF